MPKFSIANKTVLIVDDSEGVREVIREELLLHESTVVEASSGKQALEIFAENPVDIIISDIVMPNGNGFFLFDQIRQLSKPPVVVLMSAYADKAMRAEAKSRQAVLLEKPFTFDRILSTFEDLNARA